MKHEIIKTDNYLLVVDEGEIKGWYYDAYIDKVKHSGGAEYGESIITRNIIAHLPLNGSPILEGVDLLPPLEEEDDVEKFSNSDFPIGTWSSDAVALGLDMYKTGYKKAKEMYKYTEEDLRKAWNAAYIDAMSIDEETYKPLFYEDFIQSLSQPKMPIGFELQIGVCERWLNEDCTDNCCGIPEKKITTTTPEGHTQWAGTYIFN